MVCIYVISIYIKHLKQLDYYIYLVYKNDKKLYNVNKGGRCYGGSKYKKIENSKRNFIKKIWGTCGPKSYGY